ncbi:MAG: acyltransferase [Bacteroidetes bacterium]|nr:acyltransferase [Fibrella sp.]
MKVEHLTFTRFVAAVLVVIFHLGGSSLDPDSIAGSLLGVGNSAVSYFFALSGFILVISSVRDGRLPARLPRATFWRNRFARIYPLYLVALGLTIVFGALTGSDLAEKLTAGPVVASALLVQAWWPEFAMQLNYPGWSLSVETLFYGLFPLLYALVVRQHTKTVLLAAGLCWALSLGIHIALIDTMHASPANQHVLHDLALYFPLLHLNTFLIGIVTGLVLVRHRARLIQHHQWLTATFVTVLAGSFWIVLGHLPILQYHHDGLFAPLFALFILWLSIQENGFTRWLSRPIPVRLGEISYGIYLLQVPVGMVTFHLNYYFLHWPVEAYVPVYIGILMITSEIGYRHIEQPARRLIRQWTTPVLSAAPIDEQFSRPA